MSLLEHNLCIRFWTEQLLNGKSSVGIARVSLHHGKTPGSLSMSKKISGTKSSSQKESEEER